MDSLNLGAVIGSVTSFIIYHVCTYSSVFCLRNDHVQLSRNVTTSLMWIKKHKAFPDAASVTLAGTLLILCSRNTEITRLTAVFLTAIHYLLVLAVHTLRNTIFVSIFIGGSSFQYGFMFLNAKKNGITEEVRSIILAILLFSSFLCWADTIRYANHLGYSIGALDFKIKENEAKRNAEKVRHENNLEGGVVESQSVSCREDDHSKDSLTLSAHVAADHSLTEAEIMEGMNELSVSMSSSFSLGFRFLFVAIPFAFYSAGPIALMIVSAVILLFLIEIDHVERSTYNLLSGFSRKVKKIT